MGSCDKTCCLTNTGISSGEKCLVIVLNKDYRGGINGIRREYDQYVKYIFCGIYEDSGEVEYDPNIPSDYKEYFRSTQMFHVWAIEHLFSKSIGELMNNPIEFVEELYSKMSFIRKSPFDLELSGQQHKDIEEMELMVKMNESINKYLIDEIKEHKEWIKDSVVNNK